MSILLSGGSGTLGRELQKHVKCWAPSREELDILSFHNELKYNTELLVKLKYETSLIVHAAAFTDLVRAEKENELCYQTNVIGTRNLASLGIPMLYISTSYVFDGEKGNYGEEEVPNPRNFYALSKLLGEYESRRTRSVVIRCLFKPRPFKHDHAITDQYSSGVYADQIAPEIAWAVRNFDRLPPTINIGGERKSTYDVAKESRPDVKPITLDEITSVKLPRDVSLNCSLFKRLKNETN